MKSNFRKHNSPLKNRIAAPLALLLVFSLTANLPGADLPVKDNAFRLALPGYHYEFPRDHFNHPDFRTEWWYYTGNLKTADGRRFGFELTFFRFGLDRQSQTSVWNWNDVWMAHLALSDVQGAQFLHTERLNRTGPGIAGADLKQARVWNGNWESQWKLDPSVPAGGTQVLHAIADRFSFDLSLKSEKPPVIHGENGVSQKAEGVGKASHYISLTRLNTSGEITLDGKRMSVAGTTWMDHEFFSHQLEARQSGWDWFSLQLDDHSELMLFRLRRTDGSVDPYSAGTYVDPQGKSIHLAAKDFQVAPGMTPSTIWTSPTTGGKYPIAWTIDVPSLNLKAAIHTRLETQEMTGKARSGTSYWEGAIEVEASRAGRSITGVGYLEMTGYAGRIAGLD